MSVPFELCRALNDPISILFITKRLLSSRSVHTRNEWKIYKLIITTAIQLKKCDWGVPLLKSMHTH